MNFKVGDTVGYKINVSDAAYAFTGKVRALWPKGTPLKPQPMLLLFAHSQPVPAANCTKI